MLSGFVPRRLSNLLIPRGEFALWGRSASDHRHRLPANAFLERGEADMLEIPRWLVLFLGTVAALLIASGTTTSSRAAQKGLALENGRS